MIPNIHQSINEIIESASPEQRVLWQQIRLMTGEQSAVRQYSYQGLIAGSELIVYSANKIYLALELCASSTVGFGSIGSLLLSGAGDANMFYLRNNNSVWNTTAAGIQVIPNDIVAKNLWFNRIKTATNYEYVKFIGYKLTL